MRVAASASFLLVLRLAKAWKAIEYRQNPRGPSIQILPTLGRKVCKYYLHWAIWIPRGIVCLEYTATTGIHAPLSIDNPKRQTLTIIPIPNLKGPRTQIIGS